MSSSCYVPIINQSPHPLPYYTTEGAAGMDIHAYLTEPITLRPLERCLVCTGLYMAIPTGLEAQVRSRSGLAIKHGISVLNAPGTIDSDYRGELKILLINLSSVNFTIQDGDRIAQLVFAPVAHASWQEEATLPDTKRGKGGFGSTGIHLT